MIGRVPPSSVRRTSRVAGPSGRSIRSSATGRGGMGSHSGTFDRSTPTGKTSNLEITGSIIGSWVVSGRLAMNARECVGHGPEVVVAVEQHQIGGAPRHPVPQCGPVVVVAFGHRVHELTLVLIDDDADVGRQVTPGQAQQFGHVDQPGDQQQVGLAVHVDPVGDLLTEWERATS